MTRTEFSRKMRTMEGIAEQRLEASSTQKARLDREYKALADAVKPYLHRERTFTPEPEPTAEAQALERAAWNAGR